MTTKTLYSATMVNSKAKGNDDDDDSDSDDSQEDWRQAMQFDRRRIQQSPSPSESGDGEDDELEEGGAEDKSDEWKCAKCEHGKDAYGMDELNEVYETPGGQEIHYGCRRNG